MKSKKKSQILLFDIGDVLLRVEWQKAQKLLQLSDKQVSQIRDGTLHDAYERGEISSDDFFYGVQSKLRLKNSVEELKAGWGAIVGGEIPGMHDLLSQWRHQFQIFGLSNTNEAHWNLEIKKFRMFSRFTEVFKSYELGLRKPEPEIYATVLARLQVDPKHIFFVDDKKENVLAARKAGMKAEIFPGTALKLSQLIERFWNKFNS